MLIYVYILINIGVATQNASEPMRDTCFCIDLRAAAQKLTQSYDEALAPAGISVTQLSQLNLIRTLNGPTLTELAEASQLERSTLGRNLKVLEKMGLVHTKVGSDARSKTIHLSRKGTLAFKRAVPLWVAVQKELAERLGANGQAQLDAFLSALSTPLAVNQS